MRVICLSGLKLWNASIPYKLYAGILMSAILVAFAMPVSGGTLYLSGGPDMNAAIAGTNEFSPGTDATIRVTIQNRGLIDMKIIRPEIVSRDDLPNTAKMVKVALQSGNSPVIVKTDPQMIGDVLGGGSSTVAFNVLIPKGAAAGQYALPLMLEYTYLYTAESEGTDNIRYYYKTEKKTVNLNINIKSIAVLEVIGVETEHLNAGTEGYIRLKLRNTGSEFARNGVLVLTKHGSSPVIPVESSVYLGDIPRDGVTETKVKVSIASTAEGGKAYPLDLILRYENSNGILSSTDAVTIGIPVEGKVDFEIVSPPVTMYVGGKEVIDVEFKNKGATTVYGALARISAVEPFTSSDDTSYLGDIAPGESKIARFRVSVDTDATPKSYGMDAEIRYKDALGNTLISDTMKVMIEVKERQGIFGLLSNPIVVSLIVVILIAVAYFVYRARKKG